MSIQLAVIGGGNMARAIIDGAIAGNVLTGDEIAVADPDQEALNHFKNQGCETYTCASELPAVTHVLLAVKPQTFEEIAGNVHGEVVYSIMAGVTIKNIVQATSANRVVRIMPNLPCSVGFGVAGIARSKEASHEDASLANALFSSIGVVVDVDESLMDAVTAVSGSGPAYVFLLAEAMLKGAIDAGLEPVSADILVRQTIRGAAELLIRDGRTASELKTDVTSKGGTTAAALDVMQSAGIKEVIATAIVAARNRGRELGSS